MAACWFIWCIHTGKCNSHRLLIGLLGYACANMANNFSAKPAENFASACGVLGCFLRTHFPNMRMIIGEDWLGWRLILRIAFLDLALKGQVKIKHESWTKRTEWFCCLGHYFWYWRHAGAEVLNNSRSKLHNPFIRSI